MAKELAEHVLGEVEGDELVINFVNPQGWQHEVRIPVKAVAELLASAVEAERKGARRG